jgi:preprotein translocase subunit SecE
MSRQNFVIVGIIVLAAVAGLALSHLAAWIFIQAGVDDFPLFSRELSVTVLIGFGLAIAGAVFCFAHTPTRLVTQEIADELSKVSWPTREETQNATVIVLATVVLCAVYLGLFDAVWLWLTNLVLGIGPDLAAGQ